MAIDMSIVICTRENLPGLKRLLESLNQQTFAKDRYEIVIADDSKDRDTVNYIGSMPRPVIPTYCVSSDGQGYQVGRNRALRNIESGLILYLDDTCVAPATLLEEHFKAHSVYRHAMVRGPVMPLCSQNITELSRFTAPQLDFTILNASIPRLGIAQIERFDDTCKESFQNNEMYWRLRRANFSEHFLCPCYCFQNFLQYQEHSKENLLGRADNFSNSAVEYYFSKPQKETLDYLTLDIKLSPFKLLFANSVGCAVALSLLGDNIEGKGCLQSALMDAVFYYAFYTKLREKLKNFC